MVFWFAAVKPFSAEITTDVVVVVLFAHDDFIDGERRGYLMFYVLDKGLGGRVGSGVETGYSTGIVEGVEEILPEGENGTA